MRRKKKELKDELPSLDFEGDLPSKDKDFNYWSERFIKRQSVYKETEDKKNHVRIKFSNRTCINFIGDLHVGSPATDYNRIEEEIETIVSTPNSYMVALGDLVDGYFFNPAQMEQIEQTPEQFAYMKALLDYVAENKRLLVGWAGDHDRWTAKMGIDPYRVFMNELNAHYIQGIGYLTAVVGDTTYRIIAAHRLKGFSMYNNLHPQMRLSKEVQGADVYISAHTHQKGHSTQAIKEFGGEGRMVDYISIGAYKKQDDYGRKLGFTAQVTEGMYGSSIILYPSEKRVEYFNDILKANKRMKKRGRPKKI